MIAWKVVICIYFISYCTILESKIHHLSFKDDVSPYIHLVDFGFLSGGYLEVDLSNFTNSDKYTDIGFTLSKGDEINEYLKSSGCLLTQDLLSNAVYFKFNFKSLYLNVDRYGDDLADLEICHGLESSGSLNEKNCYGFNNDTNSVVLRETRKNPRSREKRDLDKNANEIHAEPLNRIPIEQCVTTQELSTSFTVHFWNKSQDGSYYFYFHNCYNFDKNVKQQIGVTFKADIVAKNENSFLSSGEIPNPHLYFTMAMLFFCTGVFWIYLLKTTKESIYKIHYLMAVLIFLKSFSLLFHGVNFYFISTYGQQKELWAIVYYIMHLLKGMLLFGVIILIGTGWTFFKNFLTDRDRKLFMVIIPLQVLIYFLLHLFCIGVVYILKKKS